MSAFPDWAAFTPEKAAADLPRLLDEAEGSVAAIESAAPAKYEDFIWALDDATDALWHEPLGVLGFWIALNVGLSLAGLLYLLRVRRLEALPLDAMKRKIGR